MSMSQYLWAVAKGLRTQVHPAVEGGARDTLVNSISILTAIANALEEKAPASVTAPVPLEGPVDTDRLRGPAENLAAYRETGAAIATAAGALTLPAGGAPTAETRAAIAWEKALLDAGIERMDEQERAAAATGSDPRLGIDRAALETYMREWTKAPNLEISAFRPILGGRSRQTALFSIANAPGFPSDMVVQRGIPGQTVSDTFLGEEGQYALLDALNKAGMRVPRPVLVETDSAPLAAPFLIVERSNGAPAQPDYWRPVEQESIALDLAREMALLHAQPIDALSAKLPQSRTRYDVASWAEEIEEFAAHWNRDAHWPSITMSAVIAWLRANVDCVDDRRTLIHNDMVFHNILAEDGQITAVLDWEQTSIGHPAADLGYVYPVVRAATDWDKFMAIYREAGGPPVPQRQINFFALRGGLRLMNLVLMGGRDTFENGLSSDVLVASAGAGFTQRLLHRIAATLDAVLEQD